MKLRRTHRRLFFGVCMFGGFALLMCVTYACMWLGWGIPLAVLWSAAGLVLFYLPTLAMLRWFARSVQIYCKGTPIAAECRGNFTRGHIEHCLVTWEDADGAHTVDLGYATLRPRRAPYPVTLYCYAGSYSLGKESVVSAGITAVLFLLVQSAILIPIIAAIR